MRVLFAILMVCFLAVPMIMGACKPPGFLCSSDSDCCAPLVCNPWAGRCVKSAPPSWVKPGKSLDEEPALQPLEEQ